MLADARELAALLQAEAGSPRVNQVALLRKSGLLRDGTRWSSVLKAVRELATADASLACILGFHHRSLHLLKTAGRPAQLRQLVEQTAGEGLIWSGLDSDGSVLSGSETDKGWRISGSAAMASGAEVADYLWLDWQASDEWRLAAIPSGRAGITLRGTDEGVGLRRAGIATVRLDAVDIEQDEILRTRAGSSGRHQLLAASIRRAVLLNVAVGLAEGALREARDYTVSKSRPWIYSGYEKHTDDPFVRRRYGDLYTQLLAAIELAEASTWILDKVQGYDPDENTWTRGITDLATAEAFATRVAVKTSVAIFEVMGARSATKSNGFDRFWRDARTIASLIASVRDDSIAAPSQPGDWSLAAPVPSNQWIAKAALLRDNFALDAVERDAAGGVPSAQIEMLKHAGLLTILVPREYGGAGEPFSTALRVSREFAKVDGSLAHLYAYHFGPILGFLFTRQDSDSEAWLRRAASNNWFWGNTSNSFSKTLFGTPSGDGWRLNGFKPFASGSHVADYLTTSWHDGDAAGPSHVAAIPADREGITINHDWDGFGQTQTGSGTVTYTDVLVRSDETTRGWGDNSSPILSLGAQIQQAVLLNVFVGTAQGALIAAREHINTSAGDTDLSTGIPVASRLGELWGDVSAATALADRANSDLDIAIGRWTALTAGERGQTAISVAAANVFAGDVALRVTDQIFDCLGADALLRSSGLDRFWRNARIHTLHNPAEYKTRTVGTWYLTGQYPEPGTFR